ncbi:MAG: flagellar brake protein [Alkalispirochaeta sp.]
MNTVANGFETSLFESVAVVSIIAALVVFFLVYGLRAQYRRERSGDEAGAQRYQEGVLVHRLTPSEEHLLQQLATTLKRPRDAYKLMERPGRFNLAAAELLKRDAISAGAVSALRVKLGFTGRPIGLQPRSSVDIPPSSTITVDRFSGSPIEGTVKASASNSLRVHIERSKPVPPPGTPLRVVYQNESGVFSFDTVVLIREDEDVYLQHSERIEKRQQRHHYRTAMRMPVWVYRVLSDEEPVRSEFIEIGGGGASLRNPAGRFEAGDTLGLVFYLSEEEVMELPVTVIRLSRARTVLHVRFGNIREAQRDRIYRMLFYTS